jgi:hypothetical protein
MADRINVYTMCRDYLSGDHELNYDVLHYIMDIITSYGICAWSQRVASLLEALGGTVLRGAK